MSVIAAGVPNITGSFWGEININGDFSADGAFVAESGQGYATRDFGSDRKTTIKFNAARCNSIYGKSPTVTPPSLLLIPQFRF